MLTVTVFDSSDLVQSFNQAAGKGDEVLVAFFDQFTDQKGNDGAIQFLMEDPVRSQLATDAWDRLEESRLRKEASVRSEAANHHT